MLRGDRGRSRGAQLSERVGFEHRNDLGLVDRHQDDEERRAARRPRERLQAGEPEPAVDAGHDRELPIGNRQAHTRRVVDLAAGEARERSLDRVRRHGGRQNPRDIRLGQVRRHYSDFLMNVISPLVSRIPHSISSSEPIPFLRADFEHFFLADALTLRVPLEALAVLDDHDRLALEHEARLLRAAIADPRDRRLHDRDRARGEHQAGERVVALRHALLDQIAEHDQEDQVERLERRELAPPHHPRDEEQEAVHQCCANHDIHRGLRLRGRWSGCGGRTGAACRRPAAARR